MSLVSKYFKSKISRNCETGTIVFKNDILQIFLLFLKKVGILI